MIRVKHGGFEVWCDGFRAAGHQFIYLSMFGVQAGVRALWAYTVNRSRPALELNGEHFSLEGIKYSTIKSLLNPQYLHLAVIHPKATSLVSPFDGHFFLLSDRPVEQYWARFSRMCTVPMRPSWRETVWELGLKHGLIAPLDGIGPILGYGVTTGEKWVEVVREAVKAGKLV